MLYGIGINDAGYKVATKVNGKQKTCPIYALWRTVLERCYNERFQKNNTKYIGCSVAKEWHTFSVFRSWVLKQDKGPGDRLNKDLLVQGNKVYSPETCLFVSSRIHSFTATRSTTRTETPVGVKWIEDSGKFRAICYDGVSTNKYLGMYDTADEAHEAYKAYKYALVKDIAAKQPKRIRAALLAYKIEKY